VVLDFRCERCGKLLRAPDDTAGRQSRCPECGNIQTIPQSSTASPLAAEAVRGAPPVMPGAGASPFAGAAPTQSYADPNNPYAAPVYDPNVMAYAAAGAVVPTAIDVGTVVSASWAVFKANMGMSVLGWFAAYLISMAISFVVSIPVYVAQFQGADQTQVGALNLGCSFISNLIMIWITLGMAIYFLRIARGGVPSLTDLFSAKPFQWLVMVLASLLMGLAVMLMLALCLGPGIALMFVESTAAMIAFILGGLTALPIYLLAIVAFFLLSFIVADRAMGPLETLGLAIAVVRRNPLSAVLLVLVNLAIIAIGFLALCVGLIIAVPYCYVIWTVAYLMMTGQRVNVPGAPLATPAAA
jgi:phage FluMu protein Com